MLIKALPGRLVAFSRRFKLQAGPPRRTRRALPACRLNALEKALKSTRFPAFSCLLRQQAGNAEKLIFMRGRPNRRTGFRANIVQEI